MVTTFSHVEQTSSRPRRQQPQLSLVRAQNDMSALACELVLNAKYDSIALSKKGRGLNKSCFEGLNQILFGSSS